jgi:hypothetical protein
MSTKNLWGDLSMLERVRTPRLILREQAQQLSEAMDGVLVGEVGEASDVRGPLKFRYALNVRVPTLNNYVHTILIAGHDEALFPVTVLTSSPPTKRECGNAEEFEAALQEILTSPEVRGVLSRLLSQVDE